MSSFSTKSIDSEFVPFWRNLARFGAIWRDLASDLNRVSDVSDFIFMFGRFGDENGPWRAREGFKKLLGGRSLETSRSAYGGSSEVMFFYGFGPKFWSCLSDGLASRPKFWSCLFGGSVSGHNKNSVLLRVIILRILAQPRNTCRHSPSHRTTDIWNPP